MRASIKFVFHTLAALAALALGSNAALAVEGSYAVPEQIGLMPAATKHMQDIHDFHNLLLVIITIITLFVLGLLIWVMVRYNARANPKPATWSHNSLIEIIWTIVPVVILGLIAVPSIRLLYNGEVIPANVDLTVKAIGHQWYWSYEYPDQGNFTFDALMLSDEDAKKAGEPRLLGVDKRVVVPVGKTVRMIITSQDVIHSWTIPAFGAKIDAVPGKLNETWFKAEREGVFYGQCSELCGAKHAFMPIAVEVVSQERFDAWIEEAKKKFAQSDSAPTALAAR
ncbi:MAG: cytochrome c oxidase subunit II [Alphaproteobacteria bacterium]|nr:cytochrome c oxidase subunit II [Alphaproteobacteria bacterium]